MNSVERLVSTIQFGKRDRQPVIAPVFGHAAILENVNLMDYLQNGELIAQCQLKALKRYHYDAVFALMDANVEAEAAGAVLEYRSNMYPIIKQYALDGTKLKNLQIPDPYHSGRMPELLQAVKRLRGELGDDAAVVGCVLGPMTVTGQLLGLEKALFLAVDEPEVFESILDFATKVITELGCAQLDAGAHFIMVFEPTGSPAVIPASFFREMIVPRLKQIYHHFVAAGTIVNYLHIAGPTQSILPFYKEAGVSLANVDYYVGEEEIKSLLPDICAIGNIKSCLFLGNDSTAVVQQAITMMKAFADRSFILSAGCEIPLESNPQNIEAMVNVAHKGW